MITLAELKEIKRNAEQDGLNERRVRCRIADSVKKSGMTNQDGSINTDGKKLIKEVWSKTS